MISLMFASVQCGRMASSWFIRGQSIRPLRAVASEAGMWSGRWPKYSPMKRSTESGAMRSAKRIEQRSDGSARAVYTSGGAGPAPKKRGRPKAAPRV